MPPERLVHSFGNTTQIALLKMKGEIIMPTKQTENHRHRSKSNEEVIREELRYAGDNYMKIWQSGMTLLPTMMFALFYFRKEMVERFVTVHKIIPGQALPIDIYLIGTLFLLVVCIAFCLMLRLVGNRYQFYAILLANECDNSLPIPIPTKWGSSVFYSTLIAFPIVDVLLFLIYQWRVQIDFAILVR